MGTLRKNPIFYAIVLLLVGACLVGLWYLLKVSKELSQLKDTYQSKASQYDRYLKARPSPTRSNLEALEDSYAELYEVYQRSTSILNLNTFDQEAFFGRTPASRADWSFTLHKYKENARYAALSNGIALPENVGFGVGKIGSGGPPKEQMQAVHRQIVVMSTLLESLFDSGIQSFMKIQRGVKGEQGKPAEAESRSGNALYNSDELFAVSPGQSISVPGTIDSHVFRVVFKGQSLALRSFLNRIANSRLPFVIRGVEAGLSSEGGEKGGLETIAENPFASESAEFASNGVGVPIIADNTSLFVVTVEFLELAVEIAEPAAGQEGEGA